MKWLVPLGFLGLIGLVVLLIIYVIKPTYQKRFVSSTFVWKHSLKFRKHKHPINKFQDLLLLILQVLTIIACAFVMAWPVIEAFKPDETVQRIAVIDASVSMNASNGEATRLERAVSEVANLADEVTEAGGEISVIMASEKAYFVSVRTTIATLPELRDSLSLLLDTQKESPLTDGACDVAGAMKLAEEVLDETPKAKVVFYTDKDYYDKGNVEVVSVADPFEYNVAILDCRAVLEENYYSFEVDVACYGRDRGITFYFEAYGVNPAEGNGGNTVRGNLVATLERDEMVTLTFCAPKSKQDETDESGDPLYDPELTTFENVYAYESVWVYTSEEDSFGLDNDFYIYGGAKQNLKVQYCSDEPNIFFRSVIRSLRNTQQANWDIDFTEVSIYDEGATEGYDLYIFERVMPRTVPKDGVVLFVNPSSSPFATGITMSSYGKTGNFYLEAPIEHPINKNVLAERIQVTACRQMTVSDEYDVVLSCYGDPAFAVKNTDEQKIAVMAFELKYSDISMLTDFGRLFFQTFKYYFPSTVTNYNFEVGESVELNARAPSLIVRGHGDDVLVSTFPSTLALSEHGTYTLVQELPLTSELVMESIYVKIPNAESDFTTTLEELVNPNIAVPPVDLDYDLLLYFAGALVLLMFAEWWVHARKL